MPVGYFWPDTPQAFLELQCTPIGCLSGRISTALRGGHRQRKVCTACTGGRTETPLERVRRAAWGMLYVDDAEFVLRSRAGLARMVTTIVEMLSGFGLFMSEKKTELLMVRVPAT